MQSNTCHESFGSRKGVNSGREKHNLLNMFPVIKVVGDWCNLKCDYCFYNPKDQVSKRIMKKDLLDKFLIEYFELFEGNLRFTWHGGEPLLAGLSFFQHVVEMQNKLRKPGQKVLNTIQTNGTLINSLWASFFKENRFRIGISLDGDRDCHNRFRKYSSGQGSFDDVVRGIRIVQQHQVPVGILQTVTRNSIRRVRENLEFFRTSLQIGNISFCIYLPIEGSSELVLNETVTPEELTRFYLVVIDYWESQQDPEFRIRQIDDYFAGYLGKMASLCSFNGSCEVFFCIDYDGKVYPCDTLSGRQEFLFGDLSRQSLRDILLGEERAAFVRNVRNLTSDCRKCEWRYACNNGCPAYRSEGGKYLYCNTRKELFKKVGELLDRRYLTPSDQVNRFNTKALERR